MREERDDTELLDRIDLLEGRERKFIDTIRVLRQEIEAEKTEIRDLKQGQTF